MRTQYPAIRAGEERPFLHIAAAGTKQSGGGGLDINLGDCSSISQSTHSNVPEHKQFDVRRLIPGIICI